jgi:CheY-like chemotaxis protein
MSGKKHTGRESVREPGCSRKTILLVDDTSLIRELFGALLRNEGYRVVIARNGDMAIEMGGTSSEIDLVITDYNMPGMNGVDVVRWFRSNRPHIALMLMSASRDNLATAAAALPTLTCLPKESSAEELLSTVAGLLAAADAS